MITRALNKTDFDQIVEVVDRWQWGPTTALVHPLFFYELGELARLVEHEGQIVGFLFGFAGGENPRTGYIHLIGTSPDYRRRGVARRLYESFEDSCRGSGCTKLKAISTTGNEVADRFHAALGWEAQRMEHYAGPGRHRMVYTKGL